MRTLSLGISSGLRLHSLVLLGYLQIPFLVGGEFRSCSVLGVRPELIRLELIPAESHRFNPWGPAELQEARRG